MNVLIQFLPHAFPVTVVLVDGSEKAATVRDTMAKDHLSSCKAVKHQIKKSVLRVANFIYTVPIYIACTEACNIYIIPVSQSKVSPSNLLKPSLNKKRSEFCGSKSGEYKPFGGTGNIVFCQPARYSNLPIDPYGILVESNVPSSSSPSS